jgi:hypothetical protein
VKDAFLEQVSQVMADSLTRNELRYLSQLPTDKITTTNVLTDPVVRKAMAVLAPTVHGYCTTLTQRSSCFSFGVAYALTLQQQLYLAEVGQVISEYGGVVATVGLGVLCGSTPCAIAALIGTLAILSADAKADDLPPIGDPIFPSLYNSLVADAGSSDASADAAADAPSDAGLDASLDASSDGSSDGPDAGLDASADASLEATPDASADASLEATPDATADASLDAGDAGCPDGTQLSNGVCCPSVLSGCSDGTCRADDVTNCCGLDCSALVTTNRPTCSANTLTTYGVACSSGGCVFPPATTDCAASGLVCGEDSSGQAACVSPIDGTWDGWWEWTACPASFTCSTTTQYTNFDWDLTVTGTTVTGTWVGGNATLSGTASGNSLSVTVTYTGRTDVYDVCTCTVSGNTMTGNCAADYTSGPGAYIFSATQ